MIKAILWDVDGTLLNFEAAEKAALKHLFTEFGFPLCTDEMVESYSKINLSYWERLERNEITKQEVLLGRFATFFASIGINPSYAEEFNRRYQTALGDTIVFCDDSKEIVTSLKGKILQYVVSNGTIIAQNKKLNRSGFDQLMDGIFLSEKIGAEKPNPGFFTPVFEILQGISKDEILIVGDSLTSDILGGVNVHIKTCWYNPKKKEAPKDLPIDYIISDLHEIYDILKKENGHE